MIDTVRPAQTGKYRSSCRSMSDTKEHRMGALFIFERFSKRPIRLYVDQNRPW
jgi:hypothetical protein